MSDYVSQNGVETVFNTENSWTILSPVEQQIKTKIESIGTPLKNWNVRIYRGILTGYNEAFIISGEKKAELIAQDPKSAEIIRPILRGRDVKRYNFEFADLWIISTFPSRNYDIDNYPAVKQYLLEIGIHRLEQTGKEYTINGETVKARKKTTNKWFETQDSISYWEDFSKQKIFWGELSDEPKFTIDEGEYYLANTIFFMTGESLKYLLAFLNSKLSKYFFSTIGTTSGMGTTRWLKYKIETFFVPKLSVNEERDVIELVDSVLRCKQDGKDSTEYEQKINNLIYEIYGFTEEEIKLIEMY